MFCFEEYDRLFVFVKQVRSVTNGKITALLDATPTTAEATA